jgi:hypothetical protein
MSRKAPVQTFENYASHTPQKMNCIASPIPFTVSLQLPKVYPPTFCKWTNFTAWKPSAMSNPQVQKFLIRCYTLKKNHVNFVSIIICVKQYFPDIFYIVSIQFSCINNTNPFINVSHVKKKTNPSILPNLKCEY